nr:MAG TPA: hypothetical protein [Caudoviricetes sp.]
MENGDHNRKNCDKQHRLIQYSKFLAFFSCILYGNLLL